MKSIELKSSKKRGDPSPCPICGMMISNAYGMSCHLRRHNNDKPFKCDKCSKAFIISSELKKHSVVHSEERPFKCDKCNKVFKKSQSLKIHIMKYCTGSEIEYACTLCEDVFQMKKLLKLHEKSVHGSFNHNLACRLCEEILPTETLKDEHEESIHGVVHEYKERKRKRGRPKNSFNRNVGSANRSKNRSVTTKRDSKRFACKICEVRFSFQSEQIEHYQEKHKEKFHIYFKSCEICGKVLNQQYYEGHKRAHKGLDFFPYACSICEYKSIRPQDLRFHMRVHTKEFPYECGTCFMLYRSKKQQTTCERKHTGVKNVKCDKCERVFFSVADLTSHRSQFHIVHKCEHCYYTTEKKRHLQKHYLFEHNIEPKKRAKKSFACDKCGALFRSQATLTIHLKRHLLSNVNWTERMKKIHRCLYCSYIGKSAEELLDHGLKSHESNMFKCELCPYVTFHRYQFTRHQNMHIRKAPTGRPRGRPRKTDSLEVFLSNKIERKNIEAKVDIAVDWECFLCGFLSKFPENMKKHFQTHHKFIPDFPWSSSNHFSFPSEAPTPNKTLSRYMRNKLKNKSNSSRLLGGTEDPNIDLGTVEVKVEGMTSDDELVSEHIVEYSEYLDDEMVEQNDENIFMGEESSTQRTLRAIKNTIEESLNSLKTEFPFEDGDAYHSINGNVFMSTEDACSVSALKLKQEISPLLKRKKKRK